MYVFLLSSFLYSPPDAIGKAVIFDCSVFACHTHPCADPEGGQGSGPPPKNKKNYNVSLQYWSGSPENHKASVQCLAIEI